MLEVTQAHFEQQKYRQFGRQNPEAMNFEFWQYMVKTRLSAWEASYRFNQPRATLEHAIWCFDRFGMSETKLKDGRLICVGGEHEDFYDDDFCIYNDVIVFNRDDDFSIYGYPRAVFPPTDFHSATLVGNHIYLIGGLGYRGERLFEQTPVYRINITSLVIEAVETNGEKPGWIHQHEAEYFEREHLIYVSGGLLSANSQGQEIIFANIDDYVLNLSMMTWHKAIEGDFLL
ncbi:MAG: hypothetical protein F6K19_23695 [Cyanothece sp. SIO1E1]|nr:hypothetical protein [Cyanothece sp. SIO1E1]